jgi:riboflavin synthase
MFTGIVTDIGTVTTREARGDTRFRIRTAYDTASIAIGASIACSGVACARIGWKGGIGGRRWTLQYAVSSTAWRAEGPR